MSSIEIEATTELEAVNTMLEAAGEAPAQSLPDPTGRISVSRAFRMFNESQRAVLTRGWWFNREKKFPLTANLTTGEYNLPDGVLKVESPGRLNNNFVQRGRRLYNKTTRSFQGHTGDIEMNVVVSLPFEDLPEQARRYIMVKSMRAYLNRTVSDSTTERWSVMDEREARADLYTEDLKQSKFNVFTDNASTTYAVSKRVV